MTLEQRIREWLQENGTPVSAVHAPGATFALSFKLPSGFQVVVQQPGGRHDFLVVSCVVNIDPQHREKLKSRADEFVWNIRHDLLNTGVAFELEPPGYPLPSSVELLSDLYEDGLNKNLFMRRVSDVSNAAALLMLTIEKYLR